MCIYMYKSVKLNSAKHGCSLPKAHAQTSREKRCSNILEENPKVHITLHPKLKKVMMQLQVTD